ncbi:MAG: polyphosphate polymerase domain-containing protein [Mogibacterium sp.]|nr:polyphosphate polymerase domain-containing protein [Mogibacterium sp.]
MGYQAVFKRYEIKYLVTDEQKARILKAMEPYMEMDRFGRSTVRNIYFDTDDFVLARHSIAKPDFKEKLRIRSYSKADAGSTVFVELKRKYDGVVYKRRIGLPETDAMKWMAGSRDPVLMREAEAESSQVKREIEYFMNLYRGVKPVLYLSYDREAYRMKKDASALDGGSGFRITFDCNILCREGDLSLRSDPYGTAILEKGMFLMELKCPGAIPMWMTKILSEEHLYKTSFSKYGTAYCSFMDKAPHERAHEIAAAGYENYAAAREACRTNSSARRTGRAGRRLQERPTSFGRASA